MQSYNEDENNGLMNDFDTKLIAPEEIEITDNPDNASALTSEVNVHVVDKMTTYINKLETNKKRKSQRKVPQSYGNARFLHIFETIVFLRADLPTNLTEVL